ncbi:MAG: YceI family protein [Proteobacteria bacterium]|nr:YceI family protein [Pseudomonadota bacterium]
MRFILGVSFTVLMLGLPVISEAASRYQPLNGNPDGTYTVDSQHSNVFFTIGHVGITEFTGRFDKIAGTYTFNSANPGKDKVAVTIPVSSLNTDFPARNHDLLGKDFFDMSQYPDIAFKSTKYVPINTRSGELYGNLDLHGVTRPVVFYVTRIGAGEVSYLPKPWGGYLTGFVATTAIHRSDYGMKADLPAGLSNTVTIKVEIEGVRTRK